MTAVTNKRDPTAKAKQCLEKAYTYEETGKLEESLYQCELAIHITPGLADAHNLKGIVLEQLNRGEEAIAAYQEAVRLNPQFEEAQQNLLEAQSEVRGLQRNPIQRRAWKAILECSYSQWLSQLEHGPAAILEEHCGKRSAR